VTIRSTPRPWSRYVAIGDSITEGLHEVSATTGEHLGWADRLAVALGDVAAAEGRSFDYANLAVRGRLIRDITGPQTDAAIALKPDLVTIWAGGNDCLRPGIDGDDLTRRYEGAVRRLRASGADVLLVTAYNAAQTPGLSWTASRSGVLTANLWSIASAHGCYVCDVWGFGALRDPRLWAYDRIHLTPQGHARLASRAWEALGFPVDPNYARPLPALEPESTLERAKETAGWVKFFLLPWVGRRVTGRSSGDGRSGKRTTPRPVDDLRSEFGGHPLVA
jgi:lysophospholipase L1-like esterase